MVQRLAERVHATFSQQELAALVVISGVTPGRGSPLPSASARPSGDALAALRAKGVIDGSNRIRPAWAAPLIALASPHSRLNATLISPALEVAASAYFTASDGIVSWAVDGGHAAVSFPHPPAGIFATVTEWMATATVAQAIRYSDAIPAAAFSAFVACVDAYRHEELLAVVERRPANVTRFSAQTLRQQLQAGRVGDPRWLAGVMSYAADATPLVNDARLMEGLDQLQQVEWLVRRGDIVEILPSLLPMCAELSQTLPCLVTTTAGVAGVGAIVAVRGRASFWAMTAADEGGRVAISALDGAGLEDIVKQQLLALGKRPAAPTTPATAAAPEPVEAAPPVKAPQGPQPCRTCGAEMKPRLRFCTKCGTKVAI